MSDSNDPPAAKLTKAQASQRYNRICTKILSVNNPDEHFSRYLSIAQNVLDAFPVANSTGNTPATLPSPEEVCETMVDLVPAPSTIFVGKYFEKPLFPLKILFSIAELYGFAKIHPEYAQQISLADYERTRAIETHVWLAQILGLEARQARSIVDNYKNAQSLFTHRPVGAPVAEANTIANTLTLPMAPTPIPEDIYSTAVLPPTNPVPIAATPSANTPGFQARHPGHPDVRHTAGAPISTPSIPTIAGSGTFGRYDPFERSAHYEDTRKATYVLQHFYGRKLTGDLSQSVDLLLRDYDTCSRQHRLTPSQKAEYFVNVLEGSARTFILNNTVSDMSYENIAELMRREYNSDSRQLQVQSTLESLKLDSFMSEHELTSEAAGLNQIVDHIERLTPQCPHGFRSDDHKIRVLRSAVIGHEWDLSPIRNIVSHRYKFNAFVTALHESLQLSNEVRSNRNPSSSTLQTDVDAASVFFQKYGRHPRHVRKHDFGRGALPRGPRRQRHDGSQRSTADARRLRLCFKCDKAWKPGHVCDEFAIRDHTRNRIRRGHSHVHIVRDLILGMEEESGTSHHDHTLGTEGEPSDGHVHYTVDAVREFDDAFENISTGPTFESSSADAIDADITTHVLSASMSAPTAHSDFQ